MQSIANVVNNVEVTGHRYLYDSMQRRTHATLEDSSIWRYDYNDRNEVIAGKRFWNDWASVAGQQFEYAFDSIGNRTSTKAGGDANGVGLRSASYTANSLNQYTSRGVPGAVDMIGCATATATNVSVNSEGAYRKGEYYCKELAVANSGGPVFPVATNTAIESGNTTNVIGSLLVPPATQSFQYDLDGNLTNDSVWSYKWDGENRLVQMEALSSVPNDAKRKLVFSYDYLGRRVSKKVYTWNSTLSSWNATALLSLRFVYDGWNLLAELDDLNAVVRSYVWGQDLSGTMDGAGGIGGLVLAVSLGGTYHFPAYDVTGNVTAFIKAGDKSTSARQEFGPFGEPIRQTGVNKDIPFRWSTRYWDEESGLVYYGYRFYSPSAGRWISRDPVEEEGGIHLYAFVYNSPLNYFDPNGQSVIGDLLRNSPRLTRTIATIALGATAVAGGIDAGKGRAAAALQAAQRFEEEAKLIRAGRNKQIRAGATGSAAAIGIGFTFTWMEAMYRGLSAAMSNTAGMGVSSDDPVQAELQSYFRKLSEDVAMAELDAITAALEMTGGVGSDAFVAWGTFTTIGQVLSELLP